MKFKVPHTFVLLFGLIVLVAIATYIIPAGEYERVENPETGVMEVDAESFQFIEQNPVSIPQIFTAIPTGMNEAAWIIFLIFIIGGAFGMINGTGAIESGISKVVVGLKDREKILIPATMFLFALGGASFGMAESTLVFIPIGVMLARRLGMDAITGMAMVVLGAAAGFTSGVLNPFTVGVAQGIAELPLFSGMAYRIIILIVYVAIGAAYVVWYGNRVKKDPTKSLVYELELEEKGKMRPLDEVVFTKRHALVLLALLAGFGVIIYGVFNEWSTGTDITATFIAMGIVAGLVGGNSVNKIAEDFVEGAKGLTYGALIVGLAYGLMVVLREGQIIDTVIYSVASVVSGMPAVLGGAAMYTVQMFINFFIPSGSGQAAVTMPIMAPIGDLIGMTRQSTVLAFHLGDGLSNYIYPTSGILMAGLSLANIPYTKWLKWFLPLFFIWYIVSCIFMVISVLINYGPF